ncbi:MAG: DedA family protein [Bacteroidetes bacterium]|nr:DedA family protein [Bacteroidota bacterium]
MQAFALYLSVMIGVLLEGDTVIIASSFAAHQDYMNIFLVATLAILITLTSDWFYFFLGRYKGRTVIEKRPSLMKHAGKVKDYIEKHPRLLLVSYRFLYGFRILTPLMIGMSKISTIRFLIISFFMTIIWASLLILAGYFFGHVLKGQIKEFERYELFVILGILMIGISLSVLTWVRERNAVKQGF